MTVKELIERLSKQPQDATVFVHDRFDDGSHSKRVWETDIESVNGPGTPWQSFILCDDEEDGDS